MDKKIETPEERIATVEEFTHAVIEITKMYTLRNGKEWTHFDQITQMLTARDALIRADERQKAAERGVVYADNHSDEIREGNLRGLKAAILAESEEAHS